MPPPGVDPVSPWQGGGCAWSLGPSLMPLWWPSDLATWPSSSPRHGPAHHPYNLHRTPQKEPGAAAARTPPRSRDGRRPTAKGVEGSGKSLFRKLKVESAPQLCVTHLRRSLGGT